MGEAKKFLSEDHMCFESQSQVSEFPQVFVYLTLEKEASMIEEHVAGQSGFEQLRAMPSAFQSDLFNPHSALRGRGYYHPTLQARTLKHRGQVATQLISSTARICTPPLKSGHLTIGLQFYVAATFSHGKESQTQEDSATGEGALFVKGWLHLHTPQKQAI